MRDERMRTEKMRDEKTHNEEMRNEIMVGHQKDNMGSCSELSTTVKSVQNADSSPMLIQRGFWGTCHRNGQSPRSPVEIALGTVNILWTVDNLEQGLGDY